MLTGVSMLVETIARWVHGALVLLLHRMAEVTRGRGACVGVQRKRLAVAVALCNLTAHWLHAVFSSGPIPVVWMINLVLTPQANGLFYKRLFHVVRQLPPFLTQDLADLCVAHFRVVPVHLSSSFLGPNHKGVKRSLDVKVIVRCQMQIHVVRLC